MFRYKKNLFRSESCFRKVLLGSPHHSGAMHYLARLIIDQYLMFHSSSEKSDSDLIEKNIDKMCKHVNVNGVFDAEGALLEAFLLYEEVIARSEDVRYILAMWCHLA